MPKVKVSIRLNRETDVWTVKAPDISRQAPFSRGVLQVQNRSLPAALTAFRTELEMHYALLDQRRRLGEEVD